MRFNTLIVLIKRLDGKYWGMHLKLSYLDEKNIFYQLFLLFTQDLLNIN